MVTIGRDFPNLLFAGVDGLRTNLPAGESRSRRLRLPGSCQLIGNITDSHNYSGWILPFRAVNAETKVRPCIASRIAGTKSVDRRALVT